MRSAELTAEMSLSSGTDVEGSGGGVVLENAKVPTQPTEPRPLLAALLGGVIGLILGAVLGYGRDRLDDRIRNEARLKSLIGDVPVLGRIPFDTRKQPARPISLVEPRSPGSEAFRALNTNLRFLAAARSPGRPKGVGEILMVTSALASEGKTTVAGNLAVTAARTGLRVLLVDADLRKPTTSKLFGVETPRGLSHLLAGQELKVRVDTAEPNLRIIGAGTIPPNPAELLASPVAATVWQQLRKQADLIVIDTPPVLSVADALEISHIADWVLLTVRSRQSREHQLLGALERLNRVGSTLTGVVWSGLTGEEQSYYGYYGEPPLDRQGQGQEQGRRRLVRRHLCRAEERLAEHHGRLLELGQQPSARGSAHPHGVRGVVVVRFDVSTQPVEARHHERAAGPLGFPAWAADQPGRLPHRVDAVDRLRQLGHDPRPLHRLEDQRHLGGPHVCRVEGPRLVLEHGATPARPRIGHRRQQPRAGSGLQAAAGDVCLDPALGRLLPEQLGEHRAAGLVGPADDVDASHHP